MGTRGNVLCTSLKKWALDGEEERLRFGLCNLANDFIMFMRVFYKPKID
jgi:hypothetical protein